MSRTLKLFLVLVAAILNAAAFAGCSRSKTNITDVFPNAEMLMLDSVEQQAMVSFDGHSFWIALPADRPVDKCRLIFVFSGRGGTGKTNGLGVNAEPGAKRLRQNFLRAGFGLVCAVCSENAFGDMQSTTETLAAVDYCRKQGMNVPEKLDLFGESMGGLGALVLGTRHPDKVGRIVDVYGITNLEEYFKEGRYVGVLGRLTEEERLERSPVLHADKLKNMEILIIHGLDDTIVRIEHSRNLYAALLREGASCRMLEYPGCGHNDKTLQESGAEIVKFFQK